MNRLTKQENGALILDGYDNYTKSLMLHKLGKLEDIEEQLGCPLEVVFKALENGIYTIDKTWYPLVNMHFENKNLYCQAEFKNPIVVHIKDYKKTWWLKEDKTE